MKPYERDGVLVLPLAGEFDVGNVADLERELDAAVTVNPVLCVDLSETGYIDSSVLAAFIRRKKAMGPSLCLVVPKSSTVRLIFEVSGLIDVLSVVETLDSAITILR